MLQDWGVYVKSRICVRPSRRTLLLGFVFILVPLTTTAQGGPQSVFVKATCNGKLSSVVLSSFIGDLSFTKSTAAHGSGPLLTKPPKTQNSLYVSGNALKAS